MDDQTALAQIRLAIELAKARHTWALTEIANGNLTREIEMDLKDALKELEEHVDKLKATRP